MFSTLFTHRDMNGKKNLNYMRYISFRYLMYNIERFFHLQICKISETFRSCIERYVCCIFLEYNKNRYIFYIFLIFRRRGKREKRQERQEERRRIKKIEEEGGRERKRDPIKSYQILSKSQYLLSKSYQMLVTHIEIILNPIE